MRLHPRASQRGFSLVELMVALVVGLLLVSGLAVLFANSSQSSSEFDKSVRQIENGRFAVDVLVEDISMAGYFGEAAASTHAALGDPCDTSAVVGPALDGLRSGSPAALPLPIEGLTPSQAEALTCLPDHKPGTPALVLRRLDTTAVAVGGMTGNLLYMQASHNPSDLNATYLVSAIPSSLTLKAKDGSTNKVRRYLSRIYYVASCNECGQDTVPTLKRAELRGAAYAVAPLSEGIDQIAFDYGFDTNNDGIPDEWRGLNAPASDVLLTDIGSLGWGNVVAVRVHVVSRTTEASSGFSDVRTYSVGLDNTATLTVGPLNDAFKRRAYTSTARLNSVAGNRERP
jgi:type IV pilus assembly protein PilW